MKWHAPAHAQCISRIAALLLFAVSMVCVDDDDDDDNTVHETTPVTQRLFGNWKSAIGSPPKPRICQAMLNGDEDICGVNRNINRHNSGHQTRVGARMAL